MITCQRRYLGIFSFIDFIFTSFTENKEYLENRGIIYKRRRLCVESINNTCDIPNEWERCVPASGQQSAQENDVYANVPSVQNIPMPSPQHYIGQQMAGNPGQQNPMNPGSYPFMHPFYMQGVPPNMYPQEGAVGQNVPPEAGNFPNPQQLWLQHMHMQQMFYQMHSGMSDTEGVTAAQLPPYTPTEENNSSMLEFLESTGEDISDFAMSQHHIDCQTQTCGSYSEFYCNSCHQRMCGECRDEHLKHPDNTKHKVCRYEDRTLTVSSVPCKLHPRQLLTLCCKKCHQAICAFCTTKEHDGHGFLNLEEVYTKNYKTRIEEIRRIRDDVFQNLVFVSKNQRMQHWKQRRM